MGQGICRNVPQAGRAGSLVSFEKLLFLGFPSTVRSQGALDTTSSFLPAQTQHLLAGSAWSKAHHRCEAGAASPLSCSWSEGVSYSGDATTVPAPSDFRVVPASADGPHESFTLSLDIYLP